MVRRCATGHSRCGRVRLESFSLIDDFTAWRSGADVLVFGFVTSTPRWQALDYLRGLSIFFMLLNLNGGSWEHAYAWLEHARWEGGHFIDLVAPVFLFCIGLALPFSLGRRLGQGATRGNLLRHVLVRTVLLVAIGLFLNGYPSFDLAHLRIPGVLQRIGLTYGFVAAFVIATMRVDGTVNVRAVVLFTATILLSYYALLQWVPVPNFGAPRFDPVGSWPAVIDRAVFTPAHMFPYWPVDGRIEFDPEGIVSTWPACANILIGVLVGARYQRGMRRPVAGLSIFGAGLMVTAIALQPFCPIIKNIWTPTFVLFTCGFGMAMLAVLTVCERSRVATMLLYSAKVYGSNALLAYMISFLLAPIFDAAIFPGELHSFRNACFVFFSSIASPNLASLLAGIVLVSIILAPLILCYRRRWFLKL